MTTLAELSDRVQSALGDDGASTWTQAEIETWVTEAVRDYSVNFPRVASDTKDTTLNDQTYGLFDDFLGIVTIEYPDGQVPIKYLERRNHQSDLFNDTEGFYDVIIRDDEAEPATLIISEKPAAGQVIVIEYLAIHAIPSSGTSTLTIPEEHEHIIILYAIYQAWRQLTSKEMISPTSDSSQVMAEMNINTSTALKDYQEALQTAKDQKTDGGINENWLMDKWDGRDGY